MPRGHGGIRTGNEGNVQALQERLKSSHGAQVWVMLLRCASVLELIARDLRETTSGHYRPGAQAGKAVALTPGSSIGSGSRD